MNSAVIYLAHMNPMTKAHEAIISKLKGDYHVYVFPVRFIKGEREINTKSFPFPYELRKSMVESIYGDLVSVFPDYTFQAPYFRYLPPLLSSRSWELRNKIVAQIREDRFVSYTGDKAERFMLKAYRLNPIDAHRLVISASSVKKELYRRALEGGDDISWREKLPESVVEIIEKNWGIVEKFARSEDRTIRMMGMKFPRDGYR